MADDSRTRKELLAEIETLRRRVEDLSAEQAERRKAEEAARESEEKAKAQFRGIPVPTYTWQKHGEDLILVDYNEAAGKFTRGGVEDYIGVTAGEMYGNEPGILQDLTRCLRERTSIHRTMPYTMRSTGEHLTLSVYYAFVPPDLVMVCTEDVSGRVRAVAALRESTAKLKSIFSSMNDLVFVMDRDRVFIDYYPPRLVDRLAAPPERFLGKKSEDVLPAAVARKATAAIDAAEETGEPQRLDYCLGFGREKRWFGAQVSVRRDIDGEFDGFTVVSRDITERKRAELELARAHDTLEQRVEERTRELVALRKEAEQVAALRERERLARDLHDAVVQTLFSISLIGDALPAVWERNHAEGRERLEELRWMTRTALAESRGILLELRPAVLASTDLGDLVRQLADARRGKSGLSIDVVVEGTYSPPTEAKVALYRIAQESLNNTAKHAAPCRARIRMRSTHERVELVVEDDGTGFDVGKVPPDRQGLGNMRERAAAVGAALELDSLPGRGTRVEVVWEQGEEKA